MPLSAKNRCTRVVENTYLKRLVKQTYGVILEVRVYKTHTVFDLISEHALISGHPPFFVKKPQNNLFLLLFLIYLFYILILLIISSDFREGNTS